MYTRTIIAAAVAAVVLAFAGCDEGNEGDRCNPDLSHDECGAGLSCQQPAECPENYCCPTDGTGTNPFCQTGCAGGAASICAATDGGESFCSDSGADEAAATDAGPG